MNEFDLETTFQTALAQFDNRPIVKRALIRFYCSFVRVLIELVRADARSTR